jgi:Sec-independent protein translocase protein TatA
MAQIGIGIIAVGIVIVALVLAVRCPADKIPELARWLGGWFRRG